ncbi:biotin--[acetyl-CoA-carboxylase] ligase [Haematomicrobium sanguinis]|uniref:biotin--[acetyl-CoA-carboxylase] ligase n=1 Tax=Haematomicrobium sanguinis TaxID=479106 RepID=UPI0004789727|nr:biotin--[acetyl-CoA-carboxylase] ligase [Haematomicrobium sanguinis]
MAPIARAPLDENWLADNLTGPGNSFSKLDVRDRSASTNAELAEALRRDWGAWPDLSILTTQHQTAGKGRLERAWDSPAETTIAVSLVLKPTNKHGRPLPTQSYGWFTLLAALALAETLQQTATVSASIKWPNDVQVDGKKISGILAQLVADPTGNPPAVVLGTGINVSQTEEELPLDTSTSIALAASDPANSDAALPTRDQFLADYLNNFARQYREFCANDGNPTAGTPSVLASVSSIMNTLGATVDVTLPSGDILTGRATALDQTGALIVLDQAGNPQAISAGDVQRVRPSGNAT